MIFTRILLFSIVLIVLALSVSMLSPNNRNPANRLTKINVRTQVTPVNLGFEHAFWARNWVVASLHHDKEQADAATRQIMDNVKTISDRVELIYGKQAGERINELLIAHWQHVKDYANAYTDNDDILRKESENAIMRNAEALAKFLSDTNTYVPLEQSKSMLCQHGRLHMEQITQLRNRMFTQEAETWRGMTRNMKTFVDAISKERRNSLPRSPFFIQRPLAQNLYATNDTRC